jgi:hypothetical protein
MTLWLRPSALVSPADADRPDYLVIEHDKVIGRIYEQRYVPPDVRWFWSITALHIDPALGIATNGRVPTLDEAKAQFKSSWDRVGAARNEKNSSSSKPTVREWRVTLMLNFGASKFLFCK